MVGDGGRRSIGLGGHLEAVGAVLLEGGTTDLPAQPAVGQAGGSICLPSDDYCRTKASDEYCPITDAAALAATDAARAALGVFLDGFGFGADEHRDRLVNQLLPGACALCRTHPQQDPGSCATLHAEQVFEAWLGFVLGTERLAGQPALPIGRAAFLACDGARLWPELVLVHDGLPDGFLAAMRATAPSLAPMPMPGAMAAQSLETWSIADLGRALLGVIEANLAWLSRALPLLATPIKLGKTTS